MKPLLNDVKAVVAVELSRSFQKFGKFNNSNHESYAIILEELEEAKESEAKFKNFFEEYWRGTKEDFCPEEMKRICQFMQEWAELVACEWIQVAAMCVKAAQEKGAGDGTADG
jgi:hypothetical protein